MRGQREWTVGKSGEGESRQMEEGEQCWRNSQEVSVAVGLKQKGRWKQLKRGGGLQEG